MIEIQQTCYEWAFICTIVSVFFFFFLFVQMIEIQNLVPDEPLSCTICEFSWLLFICFSYFLPGRWMLEALQRKWLQFLFGKEARGQTTITSSGTIQQNLLQRNILTPTRTLVHGRCLQVCFCFIPFCSLSDVVSYFIHLYTLLHFIILNEGLKPHIQTTCWTLARWNSFLCYGQA